METRNCKIPFSKRINSMEDRISRLPEELLSHILSFLPTKNAVATSVLSKKWKSMWRSVPTLDIDDDNISQENHARFVESFHAFIRSRHHGQPIQKFRLRFSEPREDSSNVIVCVKSALQRLIKPLRVEHLDIALPFPWILGRPQPIISPVIFSCTNIVVLKLQGSRFEPLSAVVDFPFLKTLHLEDLLFSKYECLAQLLSGCPILEDFKEIRVVFDRIDHFTEREFHTLPKLLRANVSGEYNFLLKAVNNVQFLHICQIFDGFLHNDQSPNPSVFPMFHNLVHIELSYKMCTTDWLEVVKVLNYCPQLQVLVINQQMVNLTEFDGFEGDWQCPQSVPECILKNMTMCYLNNYRGTKGEYQFARYIMQNGRFLENMTVCSSYDVNQEGKLMNLKELSSCSRQSATCKLSFQ